MEKTYKSIKQLLQFDLSQEEGEDDQSVIDGFSDVRANGFFTRDEFLRMCRWKSPRPRHWQGMNSEEEIRDTSSKVFATDYEKRRMELLTRLKGVSIPTGSAILMLTDPKDYGVIDIRVWQVMYLYDAVRVKPSGVGFNMDNWINYLMQIRYFAHMFEVKARDVERTLFKYHVGHQEEVLYKYQSRMQNT